MKKNALVVLVLCALFLFYKYIAQLFPTLIGTELMQVRGYDAVMLAVMASSYYYSYSFMQLVSGVIIDRYSVRTPMFCAILMISLMTALFSYTDNFYLMCLSRALMGVGASFATLIYMKCAAHYTTPRAFGIISSFLATATMLGAACGSAPVAALFQKLGWHAGLYCVAALGLVMALAVLIFQRADTGTDEKKYRYNRSDNFKEVICNSDNWWLLIYSGLTFSPVAVMGGLWGTPFIMAKYSMTAADASFFLSVMFVGLAVGAPFWAFLSAKTGQRKKWMLLSNILSMAVLTAIIYGDCGAFAAQILFFIFGFSVGCFMLSFELCREINSIAVMALSVAFINSGEGLVSAVLEPFIGHLLDVSRVGANFSPENYQAALCVLPCCFVLSSAALFFINRRREAVVELTGYAGA